MINSKYIDPLVASARFFFDQLLDALVTPTSLQGRDTSDQYQLPSHSILRYARHDGGECTLPLSFVPLIFSLPFPRTTSMTRSLALKTVPHLSSRLCSVFFLLSFLLSSFITLNIFPRFLLLLLSFRFKSVPLICLFPFSCVCSCCLRSLSIYFLSPSSALSAHRM